MCKELAQMEVSGGPDKNPDSQECSCNFRKLILDRCQKEYEKHAFNEEARNAKLKQIEECPDSVSIICAINFKKQFNSEYFLHFHNYYI